MNDHECTQRETLDRIEIKIDKLHDKVLTHRLVFDFTKWFIITLVPVGCVYLTYYLAKK